MKCAHCGQRKGKRSCPALAGSICSECCGTQRMREIACPLDCQYLGGLAAIADPEGAIGKATRGGLARAQIALFEHSRRTENRFLATAALSRFRDPATREVPEWTEMVAGCYLGYGMLAGPVGDRLVDRLLASHGSRFDFGLVAGLLVLRGARASLFEILRVDGGAGLAVEDLISGERLYLHEVSVTTQAQRWDLLFTWVGPLAGKTEILGAVVMVPRSGLEGARRHLADRLAALRRERPGIPDAVLTGELAPALCEWLMAPRHTATMPQLRTLDDEETVFCKARFDFEDEGAVRALLSAHPELEPAEQGFTWLDRAGRKELGGPLVLGHVDVRPGRLVLETTSRERLARGKDLLETALGSHVRFRADAMESVASAMDSHFERSQAAGTPDEIPPELQAQLVGEHLRRHYSDWADQPLPALGGETARQAVRTDRGCQQVEALIRDIENSTLRMPGGDSVDFDALRLDLGLLAGQSGLAQYDVARGPDPDAWLALGDPDRARLIEAHHRDHPERHPADGLAKAHATLHLLVENQLAIGHPACVRAAFSRLVAAGLSRHETIHAIGSYMVHEFLAFASGAEGFDTERYSRALAALSPEAFRSTVP